MAILGRAAKNSLRGTPLISEALPGSWPGWYMRMDSPRTTQPCTVSQSVQYHKLPPPSVLRPATSQARLHGVLGRKSVYDGQRLESRTYYI
jgi:hypothetical protein